MVILRRQWVEHEQLIFPILKVPMAMMEGASSRSLVPPFFKSRLMWAGLILVFAIQSTNALHHYFPFLPVIPRYLGSISVFRRTVSIPLTLNFMMLGFAYFLKADVMVGLWVFYFLRVVEHGVLAIIGAGTGEAITPFAGWGSVWVLSAHRTMGAMIVLVLFSLWAARGHLKGVFWKAFRGDEAVDDSDEILSYRAAMFGVIAGLVVMAVWLWRAGLPLWITPLFLFGTIVVFITLTRLIVEAGLPTPTATSVPCFLVISGIGVRYMEPSGMIAMTSTLVWGIGVGPSLMAPIASGLKLSGDILHRKRWLLLAIVIALGIGLFSSLTMTLWLAYRDGGSNLYENSFVSYPYIMWNYATVKIRENAGPNGWGWIVRIIGGVVMAGLIILRRRFLWWPLHPLGFTVSASWVMNHLWLAIFVAWVVKSIILKYGGVKAYQSARPFFYGLILGQFVSGGVWLIVDAFTGMRGSWVYVY
jgi:hypothetical protein